MNEQTIAVGESSNEGSDWGSPAAGAVDPSSIRRISDLGSPTAQAPKMTPLPELFGEQPKQKQQQPQPAAEQGLSADEQLALEQQILGRQQPEVEGEQPDDEVQGEQPNTQQQTPEQLAAQYQELMENPELDLEVFGDKVLWFDADGKGDMVPIRVRDISDNILMRRDYQRKTAEVAEMRREQDARDNGRKAWTQDLLSGDSAKAQRALRAIGADKTTMRALVMDFVREQSELEQLTPTMRQRFIEQQAADDRAYYAERKAEQLQRLMQQREQQEFQEQGVNSPAVTHVQQTINDAMPEIQRSLGISDAEFNSDAFQYNLNVIFERAAKGKRNADGTWAEAPVIQLGRTPSKTLIRQLVLETKQSTDKLLQRYGRKTKGPKVTPPPTFKGSGPAAAPGQRGNLSAPQRMRFSDLGKPIQRT